MGKARTREIAAFDEGELWCDDDAVPPLSPAGWYFRAGGGTPWIGPFADAVGAREAPFSGDSLRDARRCLDRWQRGEPPPRPRPALAVVAARREPPAPEHLVLDGGAGSAPPRPPKARRRRTATAEQLSFGL